MSERARANDVGDDTLLVQGGKCSARACRNSARICCGCAVRDVAQWLLKTVEIVGADEPGQGTVAVARGGAGLAGYIGVLGAVLVPRHYRGRLLGDGKRLVRHLRRDQEHAAD